MIKGEKIALRSVRVTDIPQILHWENDPNNWLVSETEQKYSFEEIILLIESAEDIYETGQLRFVIELVKNGSAIGTIDFFQANFDKKSVHVGILIAEEHNRRKGYAEMALRLGINYCSEIVGFEQMHCSIQAFNKASLDLFKKCGFEMSAEGKENPIFDSNSVKIIKMMLWLKK